jgi:hypothetical protein
LEPKKSACLFKEIFNVFQEMYVEDIENFFNQAFFFGFLIFSLYLRFPQLEENLSLLVKFLDMMKKVHKWG